MENRQHTAPPSFGTWQPRDGELVHLNRANRWNLPAGRYRLNWNGGPLGSVFTLAPFAGGDGLALPADALQDAESLGTLTVLDPEQDRLDAERVAHRLRSPMRGRGQLEPGPLFTNADQGKLF